MSARDMVGDKGFVLVTGATGFVGRHVVMRLLALGCRVRVTYRTEAQHDFLKKLGGGALDCARCSDLFHATHSDLADLLAETDRVIHCAWYAEHGQYLNSVKNLDCVSGTLALAKAAVAADISHFTGLGTCLEYGHTGPATGEDAQLVATNLYSASKISCFQILSEYFKTTPVKFAWGRLFFLYGEGEHPDRLFPSVVRKHTNGETIELRDADQLRDYISCDRASEMICGISLKQIEGPKNICSGNPMALRLWVEKFLSRQIIGSNFYSEK
jgi:nucleoside-diphosphate-sugar epimerase